MHSCIVIFKLLFNDFYVLCSALHCLYIYIYCVCRFLLQILCLFILHIHFDRGIYETWLLDPTWLGLVTMFHKFFYQNEWLGQASGSLVRPNQRGSGMLVNV